MGGAPETEIDLMPDKEAKGNQTFDFTKGDGERWLCCMYGGMRLVKRLDDRAMTCTVTTKTKNRKTTFLPWCDASKLCPAPRRQDSH